MRILSSGKQIPAADGVRGTSRETVANPLRLRLADGLNTLCCDYARFTAPLDFLSGLSAAQMI
jgi:hypothetical protein